MWIAFPTVGWLSIVAARKGPEPGQPVDSKRLMVRARSRKHLENFCASHPRLAGLPILETPNGDYAFRVIAPKLVVAAALAALAKSVTYTNVKGEAARNTDKVGEEFVEALHDTWSAMLRIQRPVRKRFNA